MKSWKAAVYALASALASALMILLLVILFTVSVAWAQPPASEQNQLVCGPRDSAVAELVGEFDERVIGRGLTQNGQAMIELFRSEAGSWTVIVTDANGVSCVVANGQVWLQTQNQNDGYVYANTRK